MPDATWWIIQPLVFVSLAACVYLPLASARRIGFHTHYGSLLFVLGVGCWFLLASFLSNRAHDLILGRPQPAASFAGVLDLLGWVLLVGSVLLFVLRFPHARAPSRTRALLRLAILTAPILAVLSGLVLMLFASPEAVLGPPEGWIHFATILVGGIGIGCLVSGAERFIRFRESALGRLYLALAVAVIVTTSGEMVHLMGTEASRLIASVHYAVAGLLATAAFAVHHAMVSREAGTDRYADPSLCREQRVLRDVLLGLRGLVGELADGVVHAASRDVLAKAGVPYRFEGAVLKADAPEQVWKEVLRAVRDRALGDIGHAARRPLGAVAASYGPDFSFLRQEAAG